MKKLSEYKRSEDGDYIDDEGCHTGDLTSFLQISILKFCGCGEPEENLLFIFNMLTILKEEYTYEEAQEKYKNYIQENWRAIFYFFWYVMDEKGLTEHGGSIPGWLEDENLYDALTIWANEQKLLDIG